jgi:hypothetical protein
MRRLRRWKINHLARLQADLNDALLRYESQCLEAAEVAPKEWREFWRAEANIAALNRKSLVNKVQMFLQYAAGNKVEELSGNERNDPLDSSTERVGTGS